MRAVNAPDESIIEWNGEPLALDRHDAADLARAVAQASIDSIRIRRRFEIAGLPERLPAHGDVLVTQEGRVWIQEFPDPRKSHVTWRVMDVHTARIVEEVSIPTGLRLLAVGPDAVLGSVMDRHGVPSVGIYPIVR